MLTTEAHGFRTPPPAWLAAFSAIIARINRVFVLLGIAMVAALMLTILQDVVLRYVANASSSWAVDFCRYMLTYLFFLGLAPALASGHHVAVDLFTPAVPRVLRPWLPLISSLLSLIFGLVLLWFVGRATLREYNLHSVTATMIPIPVWWIYLAGPLGTAQFVLTAMLHAVRALRGEALFDSPPPSAVQPA